MPVLADIMSFVPWPGFGPFESYDADETVAGGERLELAGFDIDVLFTPGHSPGHVTYSIPAERALFSGDVLFQGSVGRTDLPGRRRADADALDRRRWSTASRRDDGLPRPHGRHHARPRAATNPFLRELACAAVSRRSSRRRAAPSTCCPSRRPRAPPSSARRAASSTPPGYGRIETPTFEATELFARGVGESTDVVQKEMYTFDDGGGRSLTLRPEGTAPICRAYLEHGMHKLPQPVRLWYLSSFFRHEAPQAGPLPPVLAGRRRGDRLRRPGGRRRDDPAAGRAARRGRRARRAPAALLARHARDARGLPRRAPGLPARARGRAVATRCASASTSTRCARSTPTTRGRGR